MHEQLFGDNFYCQTVSQKLNPYLFIYTQKPKFWRMTTGIIYHSNTIMKLPAFLMYPFLTYLTIHVQLIE